MKTFKFDRNGLEAAMQYKDHVGILKQAIEDHPEVLPLALLLCLGVSVSLLNPLASAVAYKSGALDVAEVAFKFMNGGF